MTGIVIVAYNKPDILPIQLGAIRLFCADEHEVIVVDNSSDEAKSAEIALVDGIDRLYRTSSFSRNSSDSHAFAANFAFAKTRGEYEHILFLDHDIFPIKPFSVPKLLNGHPIGGLGQAKHKTYLWPGFVFWRDADIGPLDFSTSPGLDTGGGTWEEVERVGYDNVAWQGEVYHENRYFKQLPYNYYSIIGDGWMHFINASGWNPTGGHDERMESLKTILDESIALYNSDGQVHDVLAETNSVSKEALPERD